MFYLFDLIVPITLILNRELVVMKKIIIVTFLVLCIVASAWGEASFKETKISAEKGDVFAQSRLGLMYFLGEGTPQNYKQAFYWYSKSAKQGEDLAQRNLGFMYYFGRGVPQDYKKAYAWFDLASANGNKDAREARDEVSKKLDLCGEYNYKIQLFIALSFAMSSKPKIKFDIQIMPLSI